MEGGRLRAEGLGREHIAEITHHEVVERKAVDMRHEEERHNFTTRATAHQELTRAPAPAERKTPGAAPASAAPARARPPRGEPAPSRATPAPATAPRGEPAPAAPPRRRPGHQSHPGQRQSRRRPPEARRLPVAPPGRDAQRRFVHQSHHNRQVEGVVGWKGSTHCPFDSTWCLIRRLAGGGRRQGRSVCGFGFRFGGGFGSSHQLRHLVQRLLQGVGLGC